MANPIYPKLGDNILLKEEFGFIHKGEIGKVVSITPNSENGNTIAISFDPSDPQKTVIGYEKSITDEFFQIVEFKSTSEKSELILKKILEITNQDKKVTFEKDWDEFTATIYIDGSHTHVGNMGDDATWEQYIDSLYDLFCEGCGLSWVG